MPQVRLRDNPNPNKKPNGESKYGSGTGLPGFFQELANFGTDISRDTGNFFGSAVPDYFTGQTTAPGQGFGDLALGTAPATSPLTKRSGPPSSRLKSGPGEVVGEPERDLLSYLQEAMGLIKQNGGGGPDFGALEKQLRSQADDSTSRIGAMYRQLRGSIDSDAPVIQQQYGDTGAALNANADQAAASTAAGYQAARDAQSQQLKDLGIEDAALVQANEGNRAGSDQAFANANIQQNRNANVSANDANRQSALSYNTNIGNAAGLEGNLQQATIQQQLGRSLAELQAQKGQQAQSTFGSSLGLAQALSQDQQSRRAYNDSQQQYAAELAAKGGGASIQDYIDQYAALLQQNGGDSEAALKQLQALKLLKGIN